MLVTRNFFLSVLNGSLLPCDCQVTGRYVIVNSPVKWPHTIGKICVKIPSKLRQNQGSNGFSSRGTPSYRPDLRFMPCSRVNYPWKHIPVLWVLLELPQWGNFNECPKYMISRRIKKNINTVFTVNVLKFWTLYSILFLPKFCFLCNVSYFVLCTLYFVKWQTV